MITTYGLVSGGSVRYSGRYPYMLARHFSSHKKQPEVRPLVLNLFLIAHLLPTLRPSL